MGNQGLELRLRMLAASRPCSCCVSRLLSPTMKMQHSTSLAGHQRAAALQIKGFSYAHLATWTALSGLIPRALTATHVGGWRQMCSLATMLAGRAQWRSSRRAWRVVCGLHKRCSVAPHTPSTATPHGMSCVRHNMASQTPSPVCVCAFVLEFERGGDMIVGTHHRILLSCLIGAGVPGVFHCGWHDEASFAASSYLLQHPAGNVLVDCPRCECGRVTMCTVARLLCTAVARQDRVCRRQ